MGKALPILNAFVVVAITIQVIVRVWTTGSWICGSSGLFVGVRGFSAARRRAAASRESFGGRRRRWTAATADVWINPTCPTVSVPLFMSSGSANQQESTTTTTITTTTTTTTNPMDAFPNLPRPILLGSASFTRKLILDEMGIPFHIVVRPIDEKGIGDRTKDDPADLVLRLGQAKMNHLVHEIQSGRCQDELSKITTTTTTTTATATLFSDHAYNYLVMTGDQVVTCHGQIMEKAESVEQACDFVAEYGQHSPSTVGSCVLTHIPTGLQVSGVDTATIYFDTDKLRGREDAEALIQQLLDDQAPVLSCAGALMVEHELVQPYITKIEGTVDSVMGLSKPLVQQLLKEMSEKLQQHDQQEKLEPDDD